MSEQQHTSGPWHAADDHPQHVCLHVYGPNNRLDEIATCYAFDGQFARAEANARLIAAAPELLEALESVLPLVKYTDDAGWAAMKKARDIVNKARGR